MRSPRRALTAALSTAVAVGQNPPSAAKEVMEMVTRAEANRTCDAARAARLASADSDRIFRPRRA